MAKKIYLSPSNQDGNMYAYGNTNEMVQCNRIAEAAKKALLRCGFLVKKAPEGQAMRTSIAESNNWGADLHIPIHTNAGGGNGTVVFVYKDYGEMHKIAQAIYDSVQAVTPGTINYGVREANFAELVDTVAYAAYVECDFHDNAKIAKWIIDHVKDIGEAIAKGVCNAYGVKYVPEESEVFYRVQVGAYKDKKNAEAFLQKVKKAGFTNAFIVEVKK